MEQPDCQAHKRAPRQIALKHIFHPCRPPKKTGTVLAIPGTRDSPRLDWGTRLRVRQLVFS